MHLLSAIKLVSIKELTTEENRKMKEEMEMKEKNVSNWKELKWKKKQKERTIMKQYQTGCLKV